MLTVVDRCNR